MATAGSFSAISALFGGPLVGAVLLVEGGLALGTGLIPVLLPGFVAPLSVTSSPSGSVTAATFAHAWFDVSPTLAIAAGSAAGMAAGTRMLIAPGLFAALLVGKAGQDAVPAAVLGAASAWLVMQALDRRAGKTAPPAA